MTKKSEETIGGRIRVRGEDVIGGRGRFTVRSMGNDRFEELIEEYAVQHISGGGSMDMSRIQVEVMAQLPKGCRFITSYCKNTDTGIQLTPKAARVKIGQAIRYRNAARKSKKPESPVAARSAGDQDRMKQNDMSPGGSLSQSSPTDVRSVPTSVGKNCPQVPLSRERFNEAVAMLEREREAKIRDLMAMANEGNLMGLSQPLRSRQSLLEEPYASHLETSLVGRRNIGDDTIEASLERELTRRNAANRLETSLELGLNRRSALNPLETSLDLGLGRRSGSNPLDDFGLNRRPSNSLETSLELGLNRRSANLSAAAATSQRAQDNVDLRLLSAAAARRRDSLRNQLF